MPECQVSQVLENPSSTLEELLNALEDIAMQYGYIAGMASHGLKNENTKTDLVRTLLVIKVLKLRIYKFNYSDNHDYPKITER